MTTNTKLAAVTAKALAATNKLLGRYGTAQYAGRKAEARAIKARYDIVNHRFHRLAGRLYATPGN
jgi:hypothetical protein